MSEMEIKMSKQGTGVSASRCEFVLLVDVTDGNPNGDPDADNQPRTDPETGHGLITDVCIKRKIRDYVGTTRAGQDGFSIYIHRGAVLDQAPLAILQAEGVDVSTEEPKTEESKTEEAADQQKTADSKSQSKTKTPRTSKRAKEAVPTMVETMCRTYYDVRTFGAVIAIKANNDRVCGPVQLTFGRSIDPVVVQEHTLTRCAVANKKDSDNKGGLNQTMGHKHTIPYGLYRFHGFVVPSLAVKSGFNDADLELLWESLLQMFEIDRSAARGLMATRALIVFKHESPLGCARSHDLFDLVKVSKTVDGPARKFSDYSVEVGAVPGGVTVVRK